MKITALEIRKKSFEKNFRGYDKEEVDAFLKQVSEDWEKLNLEFEDLQNKLEASIKESSKMKEVEASLFRTLKTAEDTGASIIEEANEASEYIVREAHQNAEAMLNDAKTKSQNLIESAESKAKQIMEDLKNDVSAIVRGYETLVQQRELILKNLKKLNEDIQDNISLSDSSLEKVNVNAHLEMVETLSKNNAFSMANIDSLPQNEMTLEDRSDVVFEKEEEVNEVHDKEEPLYEGPVIEAQMEEPIEEEQNKAQVEFVEEAPDVDEPEEDQNKGNKNKSFFDEVE